MYVEEAVDVNIRGGKAIYVEEAICVDVHTMTPCTLILTLACINEHACSERARHGAACKCARHTWMYISMGRKTHGYIYIYRGRNTWIYTSIERETHGTPASGQELHLVITSSHTAEEPYFSTKEPYVSTNGRDTHIDLSVGADTEEAPPPPPPRPPPTPPPRPPPPPSLFPPPPPPSLKTLVSC